MGELIKNDPNIAKQGRPSEKGRTGTTFLKDLGISKDESSLAQKIYDHWGLVAVIIEKSKATGKALALE